MNEPVRSVVVPIEEGASADWAVDHVVQLYRERPMKVYLLCVRQPFPQYIARFISRRELKAYHEESGMQALSHVAQRLDSCGIPHWDIVQVGQKAPSIVEFAREHHCSQIILSQPAGGNLSSLVLGSIGGQIRKLIGSGESCTISEVY
ncbi:MAG: universal stress protein [Burkholderiales bacterium]